jgi:hypothetical protein
LLRAQRALSTALSRRVRGPKLAVDDFAAAGAAGGAGPARLLSWPAQAVYAYAYAQGSRGFTDDEMMAYFRSHRSTYRSRRSELTRAGLIMDTGRTRILPTRRSAIIWAIVDPKEVYP